MVDRPGGPDEHLDEGDGPALHGAAEPLTVGREPRARKDVWRPKVPHFTRWTVLIIAVLVLLAFTPAFIGGLKKTPKNMIGISYGGGPFEATHYQRIVQPGSGLFFNGFYDPLYLYPSDQVNYIISKQVGVGATKRSDSIVAPTEDRVLVTYQIAVYFKLNPTCSARFTSSWVCGTRLTRRPDGRADPGHLPSADRERAPGGDASCPGRRPVRQRHPSRQAAGRRPDEAHPASPGRAGHQFFCSPQFHPGGKCGDPTFVIKTLSIPKTVAQAFQANRTSAIQILTKQNEVAQRAAEAQSIRELGLTGQEYETLKAIESGKVSFWVLPNSSGLNLTAPSPLGSGSSVPATPSTTTTTKPPTTTATKPRR